MNTTRALTLFLALTLLGLVFLALATPTARAADPVILRITTSGTTAWPCGDLDNWSNPCALQTALTRSVSPSELWVAAGTYTPTTGTDRTATFQLRDNIALYGGFAMTETLRTQRNITANITILSGDLNGDDNGNVRYDEPTRADNSYHVVTGSGVTNTAVLDGFTVTDGNSSEYSAPNERGGGIYNNGASPTFNNVILTNNSANYYGGGMANDQSSPTLTNVTFINNAAYGFGGGMYSRTSSPMLSNVTFFSNTADSGGAMTNSFASSATLTNVTFSGNSAITWGGGMFNSDSSPTLTNITFISNTAYYRGGGMYNDTSSPTLTNVTFSGNSADSANSYGGGMYNDTSNPVLTDVTFSGNSAWIGGGMENYISNSTLNNVAFISNTATGAYGGLASGGGSATLTNVTFSGNSAPYGGGMGNETKSMTLTNVTFSGNTATWTGGGMENYQGSPTLTNVTFSGNSAGQDGGGMHNRTSSSPTIRNAIFWGNNAPSDSQIGNDSTSTSSLSDSVVQGGCPDASTTCTHIITTDPLLGALSNYGGATQTIRLLPGSSAIDAGNNAICPPTDQRGKPRVATCDIGAFEFQGLTLTKTGGDQQSALVNTAFANPLQVTLTEIESGLLAPGIVLTFSAPSSGTSAAWSGSLVQSATTNASGVATVGPPTANSIAGSYVVTATTAGANPPATFALTNLLHDSFLPLIRR